MKMANVWVVVNLVLLGWNASGGLAQPDIVQLDGRAAGASVSVSGDGKVVLADVDSASFVTLKWNRKFAADAKVLGGMWERTYGDSAWRRVDDKAAPRKGTMPWYFLVNDGGRTDGYGVMVQPNAFACWTVSEKGIVLSLDVRAGLAPVRPRGRHIELCTLVFREGKPGESAFAAGRAFCRMMCPSPRLPKEQVYGYNDWYCAYGNNTATNFLADAAFVVSLLDRGEKVANRPFFVVDDGWQLKPQKGDAIGPDGQWCANNPRWGMAMDVFASKVKALDARPGLWYRPFYPDVGDKGLPVDPTDPVWERNLRRDLARFRAWGFELVKIDFITWDWGQTWGYELGDSPCGPKACAWKDDAHTGAETVKRLYRAMREAAGDDLYIIGCNAVDHFAAGLFELQRTGDDTDGRGWARTRKMGPNTIGMRAIQNRTFYLGDGDCVGLVNADSVPWEKNRQWLDLVAKSGTSLFISWKRALAVDPVVADALSKALKTASHVRGTGEPLDWMVTPRPTRWAFDGFGEVTYDWDSDLDYLKRKWREPSANQKPSEITWDFPRLGNCHEGLAFSDGITGVLVWGGGDTINLTVGRADMWDHRGGYPWTAEQSYTNIVALWKAGEEDRLLSLFKKETPVGEPRNPYMLPLGRVVVKLGGGVMLTRGELDPFTGLGKLLLSDGKAIHLAMSKRSRAFALRLPEGVAFELKSVPATEFDVYERNLKPCGFEKAVVLDGKISNCGGFRWKLPADDPVWLTWGRKGRECVVKTGRGDRVVAEGAERFAEVAAESSAQWTTFWTNGARVHVPDPVLQRIYDYGMYRFGAMTDPDGVPAGLQGPWLEDDQLVPWNGDYHFNINVQECYSPAFRGGHFEHLMPLFRMILSWRPRLRDNAHKFCGIEDGYVMPHSVDDRGVCIGGFWSGTIDHASTAWMASYMFRYVKYAKDVEFLRESAYDFMKGAMNVYLAMMDERNGALAIPLAPSPEWMGADFKRAVGRNSSFQLAACHRLAKDLVVASEMLGEKPDPRWLDVDRRLPAFSRVTEASGDAAVWGNSVNDGIAIFEGVNLHESHRHHSHMAGIYPFDTIDRGTTMNRTVLDATYGNWVLRGTGLWTGWCVPWASILHTDAGNAPAAVQMLRAWDAYFCDEGHGSHHNAVWDGFTNFRHGRNVMQMDGACAAVTAVLELLAHERDGRVEFFRGCPAEWKDVSFENLALSDGRRVSGRRLNGVVTIDGDQAK